MADEGEAGPVRRPRRFEATDGVVAVVITATWAFWFRLTDGSWFYADEWLLALRGRSPGDFLEPYNGHLSVTYLAVYRAHMALFGFDHYGVLRAIGLAALAATPALLYLTTRRPLGRVWAGVLAVAVLWTAGVALEPGAMNHSLVLACTVVVAWALRRHGRRADLWLAASLTVGFLTAGGMVAAAVGAVVHSALNRADLRRWTCVAVPTVLWLAWYLPQEQVPLPEELHLSRRQGLEVVVDGHFATLQGLAFDNRVGAWLLVVAIAAVAVARVRTHGWPGFVVLATWWTASIAWWVGLVQSRQFLALPDVFRYRLVCSVFLLLALVPPEAEPDAAAPAPRARVGRRPELLGAAAVAVLAVALVWSNEGDARANGNFLEWSGLRGRLTGLIAFADPPIFDPDERLTLDVGAMPGADYTRLRELHGLPGLSGTALDRALVDTGAVLVEPAGPGAPSSCQPVDGLQVTGTALLLVVGDEPTVLQVHQFGPEPIEVARVPAGRTVRLLVPVNGEWVLDAPGACAGLP